MLRADDRRQADGSELRARRNEFWKMLGYPNLVRAREAKKEHARRRRLILGPGPTVWCGYNVDHSVDHLLEIRAPVLQPRRANAPRGGD